MKAARSKTKQRESRHRRIRARVRGTAERPRLAVYKSNRYLYAQLIDDEAGTTLAACSTEAYTEPKLAAAARLGGEIAVKAKERGFTKVVFDRGGFRYAGRVAAAAEAARKGGLEL